MLLDAAKVKMSHSSSIAPFDFPVTNLSLKSPAPNLRRVRLQSYCKAPQAAQCRHASAFKTVELSHAENTCSFGNRVGSGLLRDRRVLGRLAGYSARGFADEEMGGDAGTGICDATRWVLRRTSSGDRR